MHALVPYILRLVQIYYWLIIVRVFVSWLPSPRDRRLRAVLRFLWDITEPYLKLFRRFLPAYGRGGVGFDFSPILGIIVLLVISNLVARLG